MEKNYRPTTFKTNESVKSRKNNIRQDVFPEYLMGNTVNIGVLKKEWQKEAQNLDMNDEDFAAFTLQMYKHIVGSAELYTSDDAKDSEKFSVSYWRENCEYSKTIKDTTECIAPAENRINIGKFINLWEDKRDILSMNDDEFAGYLLHIWNHTTKTLSKDTTPEEMNGSPTPKLKAFVTVATDDNYATGALVLGASLRNVKTSNKLVILITSDVSSRVRNKLSQVFDEVHEVNLMESKDDDNLALMSRLELGKTFTKLHIWKLTHYSKCVFLDADTLVLKNCDELFEKEELSAVPDIGWPDCFNSGVFVFVPSDETFQNLFKMAMETGSFDGGDQGLLNSYFSEWATKDIACHLSFIYNMVTSASYTYLPAYKHYGHKVKIIHFLGTMKPWHHMHGEATEDFEPCENCQYIVDHLRLWWDIYKKNVSHIFQEEEKEEELVVTCQELQDVSLGSEGSETKQTPLQETPQSRQLAWEQGQIDYLGTDSFEHIKRKLEEAINDTTK